MSPTFRICLVISAFLVILFVTRTIKKVQFSIGDSLFWLFLSICLLILAIFPGIAYFFSDALGIQSPSNFIFLSVIALLLVRELTIQAQVSQLKSKITSLAQEMAIRDTDTTR